MNKTELRDQAQAKWGSQERPISQQPEKLAGSLLTYLYIQEFTKVMFYWPMWDEVDITQLIRAYLKNRGSIILMRCNPNRTMSPRYVFSPTDLVQDKFGIWVPKRSCPPIDVEELEAVVIPGRAFDSKGNRIGRGYGYYDRFLSQPSFVGQALGVAYEFQMYDRLPTEKHDIPVDLIFTEKRVIIR